MSVTFKPAVRVSAPVLIGLSGPSGCGKTKSALRLATGLAGPHGKIYGLDTEGGRMLHYAPPPGQEPVPGESYRFEHGDLHPPFTPDAYRDAIWQCNENHADVVIIDSMSHEYEGEGGILEWAEELEFGVPRDGLDINTIPENDRWKREYWKVQPVKSPGNWKEPKRSHKRMIQRLLQCRAHLIFCLRAEEKMLLRKKVDEATGATIKGKVDVVPADERPLLERWTPICEKRFMYEMTASFLMLASNPGVPIPVKLQNQHRPFFPTDRVMDERSGELLAEWARGANAPIGSRTQQKSGKLIALYDEDGAELEALASATTWLTAYEHALDGRTAAQIGGMWDSNRATFDALQDRARTADNKEFLEKSNSLARMVLARSTPPEGEEGADDVHSS